MESRRNKALAFSIQDEGFVVNYGLKFLVKIGNGPMQILRLTTPKLRSVWGPVRSG
jgi:hypothetical protein